MSRRSGAKGHRDRTGSVFQLPDHGSGSDCGGVPQHSLLSGEGPTGLDGSRDDFDARLGARLRGWRERRGLSLPDVAEEIGVSYQQLQKYEAGRNSLSVARLVRIADLLDVPPLALLDEVSRNKTGADSDALQRNGERYRLRKAYFALPEPVRLAVLRLMETEAESRRTPPAPPEG